MLGRRATGRPGASPTTGESTGIAASGEALLRDQVIDEKIHSLSAPSAAVNGSGDLFSTGTDRRVLSGLLHTVIDAAGLILKKLLYQFCLGWWKRIL